MFNSKCLPVLLYGLEACSLSKSDLSSIDFALNRFFMKLFRTNNIETVKVSRSFFGISLPSVVLHSWTDKFEQKFSLCADLVKALVWAAVILPCCLCLFDFFYLCATVLPLCLVNKVEYNVVMSKCDNLRLSAPGNWVLMGVCPTG